MNYINLSDMKLSQIVLGTDGYGERIDKKTAFELMELYVKNGGNVLDTARMYTDGKSEKIVGEFAKSTRDNLYISTKCGFPYDRKNRLSEQDIVFDVITSLDTLNLEYIDILWLHRDDTDIEVEYIIDTLNKLRRDGKVKYFGASNWSHDRIMQANAYAQRSNQYGFIASQPHYNLASRSYVWDNTLTYLEGDELSKYLEQPFPVFAFSAQAKGFFEKYSQGTLSPKAKERYFNEKTLKTYEKIIGLARKTGDSISYTALKMLIEQSPFDVFPIIGPSNTEQLKQTLNITA